MTISNRQRKIIKQRMDQHIQNAAQKKRKIEQSAARIRENEVDEDLVKEYSNEADFEKAYRSASNPATRRAIVNANRPMAVAIAKRGTKVY